MPRKNEGVDVINRRIDVEETGTLLIRFATFCISIVSEELNKMAEKFVGKFGLVSSDNFDKYLEKLGVGYLTRKMATSAKPDVEFIIDGDQWTFKTLSAVRNLELKFKLNEEFEETTGDGRKVKTTFTLENGNKLVQTQKATKSGEKDSVVTRELNGDELVVTMEVDDVQAKRLYKRYKQ